MTHVTCRLTATNQGQLRNHTLGNRVWATFTFLLCCILASEPQLVESAKANSQSVSTIANGRARTAYEMLDMMTTDGRSDDAQSQQPAAPPGDEYRDYRNIHASVRMHNYTMSSLSDSNDQLFTNSLRFKNPPSVASTDSV